MRSLFTFVLCETYYHPNCCASAGGINLKRTSNQLHSLLHAGDANTSFEPGLLFLSRHTGRGSANAVADFQGKIRVVVNSYLSLLTPRMALVVGVALLHYSE